MKNANVRTQVLRPKQVSKEVAGAFGGTAPKLEKRTLFRKGKPLASTYLKVRG